MTGLEEDSSIRAVARTYGKQFHKRVVDAYPPFLAYFNDAEVPCTDYCMLVATMPRDVQVMIAHMALAKVEITEVSQMPRPSASLSLRRSSWSSSASPMSRLRQEVLEGSSLFVSLPETEVLRLVFVVALQITHRSGRILAQVGKWAGSRVRSACELPGGKKLQSESSEEAMERHWGTVWIC